MQRVSMQVKLPHHYQVEAEDVLQRVPGVLEPPAPPDHVGSQEQDCAAASMHGLEADRHVLCTVSQDPMVPNNMVGCWRVAATTLNYNAVTVPTRLHAIPSIHQRRCAGLYQQACAAHLWLLLCRATTPGRTESSAACADIRLAPPLRSECTSAAACPRAIARNAGTRSPASCTAPCHYMFFPRGDQCFEAILRCSSGGNAACGAPVLHLQALKQYPEAACAPRQRT